MAEKAKKKATAAKMIRSKDAPKNAADTEGHAAAPAAKQIHAKQIHAKQIHAK